MWFFVGIFYMFCGIVEEKGIVESVTWQETISMRISIRPTHPQESDKIGDSISVNGCCLTISQKENALWHFDLVPETVNRTNLKFLRAGDSVNLERAMRYQDRVGGHLVQGHVDNTGKIIQKKLLADDSWMVTIETAQDLARYMIHKGSIAVDGVSLTIVDINNDGFSIAMIPHTAAVTTLGSKKVGESVNIEVDLMAKYIEKLLPAYAAK